ncbi:MAG: hypothetical protein KBT03_08685 [Bacteroidales bacterium]|nr:hypothetical protein [Candidatus Scybalousia scybalohippi]
MEKEFNFDETYNNILEQAKENGMYDDMVFQTLMREFKSVNELCLRMKEDIDNAQISDVEEGSTGQFKLKSNPVIKDYLAAQKNLVNISAALEKKLANVNQSNEDDWL